nr:hypothetical protein CFP56_30341 [Quercus suber]
MDSDGFVMDSDGVAIDLWVSVLIKTEMGFQFLILGNKQTTTINRKSMNIRDGFGKKRFTFRSSIWAVEEEIIEIGSENQKPTLTGIGFKGSVNDRSDKLVLTHHKSDRTGSP